MIKYVNFIQFWDLFKLFFFFYKRLLTGPVGVNVLSQLVHSAQADHWSPTEPERCHRPKLIMKAHQELVQASSVHYVLQIPISGKVKTDVCWKNWLENRDWKERDRESVLMYLLLLCGV